jgi:hypothetical protein
MGFDIRRVGFDVARVHRMGDNQVVCDDGCPAL